MYLEEKREGGNGTVEGGILNRIEVRQVTDKRVPARADVLGDVS